MPDEIYSTRYNKSMGWWELTDDIPEALEVFNNTGDSIPARTAVYLFNTQNGLEMSLPDGSATGNKPVYGFLLKDTASGKSGVVRFYSGLGGFSGLVPGKTYYHNPAVPGGIISDITGFNPGEKQQPVGFAVNPTTLFINPGLVIKRTVNANALKFVPGNNTFEEVVVSGGSGGGSASAGVGSINDLSPNGGNLVLAAGPNLSISQSPLTNTITIGFSGALPDLANHKNASPLDHPDGSVTDAKIGNRTVDPNLGNRASTGTITALLSWIAGVLKQVTGKSNWFDTPSTSLEAAANHMANAGNPHGTTAAHTGALVSLAGVSNPGGGIALTGGAGVTITPDASNKTIQIDTTGITAGVGSVNGVSNSGGNISLVAGSNITISPNQGDHTIQISVSGINSTTIGALTSLDGVSNPGGNIDFVPGGGISIVSDNSNKRITFTAEGLYSIAGVSSPGGNIDLTAGAGMQIATDPTNKKITLTSQGILSIDGVSSPGGNVDFVSGPGMQISSDPTTKKITFTATTSDGAGIFSLAGVSSPGSNVALQAGPGVTITPDNTAKQITIGLNLPLTLAQGGTGSTTAAGALSSLGAVSQASFTGHINATTLDHPNSSVTDPKIGNRTISQDLVGTNNTGQLTQLLSWLAGAIKRITGKTSWYDTPSTNLEAASLHINNTSNPHSVTANQIGAPTSVGGISNPGGDIGISAGANVTIDQDTANKRLVINASGGGSSGGTSFTLGGVTGSNILLEGGPLISVTPDNTAKKITVGVQTPIDLAHGGTGAADATAARTALGAAAASDLTTHTGRKDNPHAVTATQVGAPVSVAGVSNPGGDIALVAGDGMNISADDSGNKITLSVIGGVSGGLSAINNVTGPYVTLTEGQNIKITPDTGNNKIQVDLNGQVDVAHGGTGASTAAQALSNLGAARAVDLSGHTGNTNNPHNTTAAQLGALTSIAGVTNPGGNVAIEAGPGMVIQTDLSGKKITLSAVEGASGNSPIDISHGGTAASTATQALSNLGGASTADLNAHTGNHNNPHGVSVAQIGAASLVDLGNHTGNTSNPHQTTAIQVGALVSVDGVSNPGGNVDLVAGAGITITPDDTANTITFTASAASGVSKLNNLTGDVTLAAGSNVTLGASGNTITINSSGDGTVNAPASIDGVSNPGGNIDLVPGAGITIVPDDAANTITISSTMQGGPSATIDGISNPGGNIDLVAGSGISIVSDDTANTITIASSAAGYNGQISTLNGVVIANNGNGIYIGSGGYGSPANNYYNANTEYTFTIPEAPDNTVGVIIHLPGYQGRSVKIYAPGEGANANEAAYLNENSSTPVDATLVGKVVNRQFVIKFAYGGTAWPVIRAFIVSQQVVGNAATTTINNVVPLPNIPILFSGNNGDTLNLHAGNTLSYHFDPANFPTGTTGVFCVVWGWVNDGNVCYLWPGTDTSKKYLVTVRPGSMVYFPIDSSGNGQIQDTNTDVHLYQIYGVAALVPTAVGGAALANTLAGISNPGGNIDLVPGTGISIVSDDSANTITISSTGGGGGASTTLDGVSNPNGDIDLVAGAGISITPDDTSNTITIASTIQPYNSFTPIERYGWAAYASQQNSNNENPYKAIDFDSGSRWGSGAPRPVGTWFKVDMASTYPVCGIFMNCGPNDGGLSIEIYTSPNDTDYTLVKTGTTPFNSGNIMFTTCMSRYIKLVFTTYSSGGWASLFDFGAYTPVFMTGVGQFNGIQPQGGNINLIGGSGICVATSTADKQITLGLDNSLLAKSSYFSYPSSAIGCSYGSSWIGDNESRDVTFTNLPANTKFVLASVFSYGGNEGTIRAKPSGDSNTLHTVSLYLAGGVVSLAMLLPVNSSGVCTLTPGTGKCFSINAIMPIAESANGGSKVVRNKYPANAAARLMDGVSVTGGTTTTVTIPNPEANLVAVDIVLCASGSTSGQVFLGKYGMSSLPEMASLYLNGGNQHVTLYTEVDSQGRFQVKTANNTVLYIWYLAKYLAE